jgi:hypothetical protein
MSNRSGRSVTNANTSNSSLDRFAELSINSPYYLDQLNRWRRGESVMYKNYLMQALNKLDKQKKRLQQPNARNAKATRNTRAEKNANLYNKYLPKPERQSPPTVYGKGAVNKATLNGWLRSYPQTYADMLNKWRRGNLSPYVIGDSPGVMQQVNYIDRQARNLQQRLSNTRQRRLSNRMIQSAARQNKLPYAVANAMRSYLLKA